MSVVSLEEGMNQPQDTQNLLRQHHQKFLQYHDHAHRVEDHDNFFLGTQIDDDLIRYKKNNGAVLVMSGELNQ